MAIRVNEILKDKFYLNQTSDNVNHAKITIKMQYIIQQNKIILIFRFKSTTYDILIINLKSILTCSHI